jgi:hypothetical protein
MRTSSRPRRRSAPLLAKGLAILMALMLPTIEPVGARADGDPASDVLLAKNVFYPYEPEVNASLESAMQKALNAFAAATGIYLKVAIIGAPQELGLVPQFFGHPQQYAEFLDREISFNAPQALLTVMPAGFGVMPAGATEALRRVPVDAKHGPDGLTRSAIRAVVALARYHGHPIAAPSIPQLSTQSSSSPTLLIFGLPVAVLILGGVGLFLRGRSRSTGHGRASDPE